MPAWDYGYRSKCCYAPIRLGRRNIKNTNKKVNIWVCCKCKARDVDIVEYIKDDPARSSPKKTISPKFVPENYDDDI